MKKITLKEFFEMENAAIHCDTEEKANKLLSAFNKMGNKWSCNYWNDYKKETCYTKNGYCSRKEYKKGFIFEFEEIDLTSGKEQTMNYIDESKKVYWVEAGCDNTYRVKSGYYLATRKTSSGDRHFVLSTFGDSYLARITAFYFTRREAWASVADIEIKENR